MLFYQDDAFGKGLLEGAREELARRAITTYKEIAYVRHTADFSNQAQELTAYHPDAVFFFSTTTATQLFIRRLGVEKLAGKLLFGNSDLGTTAFKKYMQTKGLNMTVVNIVPNPRESTLPIVQEYRQAMASAGYGLDQVSLQSYIAASLFIDLIDRTPYPITKEKMVVEVQTTKDYKFKGLSLTFDPATNELNRDIWLDTGSGDWVYRPGKITTPKKEVIQEVEPEQQKTIAPENQLGILSSPQKVT